MSKRLQVLIQDQEYAEIQHIAAAKKISVAEWVRQALRTAKSTQSGSNSKRKLEAIRISATYEFPTADIDQMIGEIESGYSVE